MSRRFQFSLGTLLVTTALIAVVVWLTYSAPSSIGVPVLWLLTATLGAFLTVTAIYGNARTRPFCIGALFPIGNVLVQGMAGQCPLNFKTFREKIGLAELGIVEIYETYQGELGLYILASFATGLLCSALHCWLTRSTASNTTALGS